MTDNKAVQGRNMIASIKIGASWFPVFCAKSCSFEFSNEIILRTGINDGLFPKRRVRRSDWSGSAAGVLVTDNTANRYSPFYLLQDGVRRSEREWQFEFTNEDGDVKTIEGVALIENLPISGDVSGWVQASVNIVGTGAFTIDASPSSGPDDENVDSDYWNTTAGTYVISGASVNSKTLTGKTVLAVAREGTVYDPIFSGTATNRLARVNSGAGSVTFDSNITFNPGETVWVMWKD
jgi:hypothetical protein